MAGLRRSTSAGPRSWMVPANGHIYPCTQLEKFLTLYPCADLERSVNIDLIDTRQHKRRQHPFIYSLHQPKSSLSMSLCLSLPLSLLLPMQMTLALPLCTDASPSKNPPTKPAIIPHDHPIKSSKLAALCLSKLLHLRPQTQSGPRAPYRHQISLRMLDTPLCGSHETASPPCRSQSPLINFHKFQRCHGQLVENFLAKTFTKCFTGHLKVVVLCGPFTS